MNVIKREAFYDQNGQPHATEEGAIQANCNNVLSEMDGDIVCLDNDPDYPGYPEPYAALHRERTILFIHNHWEKLEYLKANTRGWYDRIVAKNL